MFIVSVIFPLIFMLGLGYLSTLLSVFSFGFWLWILL